MDLEQMTNELKASGACMGAFAAFIELADAEHMEGLHEVLKDSIADLSDGGRDFVHTAAWTIARIALGEAEGVTTHDSEMLGYYFLLRLQEISKLSGDGAKEETALLSEILEPSKHWKERLPLIETITDIVTKRIILATSTNPKASPSSVADEPRNCFTLTWWGDQTGEDVERLTDEEATACKMAIAYMRATPASPESLLRLAELLEPSEASPGVAGDPEQDDELKNLDRLIDETENPDIQYNIVKNKDGDGGDFIGLAEDEYLAILRFLRRYRQDARLHDLMNKDEAARAEAAV